MSISTAHPTSMNSDVLSFFNAYFGNKPTYGCVGLVILSHPLPWPTAKEEYEEEYKAKFVTFDSNSTSTISAKVRCAEKKSVDFICAFFLHVAGSPRVTFI